MRRKELRVFLNIPYDRRFADLYLAYIAGTAAFGLIPRATVEIPGGQRRLDRIFELIRSCRYSVHDLSRVQLDRKYPPTPRFNMPFELGLTVAWQRTSRAKKDHLWFVFEAINRRLAKSLSDLDGTDPYIHGGQPHGVFRELRHAFVREHSQPTVPQMRLIHQDLKAAVPGIKKETAEESLFKASVFAALVLVARDSAQRHIPGVSS